MNQVVKMLLPAVLVVTPVIAQPISLAPSRCGPPRSEDSVSVIDISTYPDPNTVGDAIREQMGPYRIVRQEEITAKTAFGRAWKKAQRTAATMGCDLVLLVDTGRVTVGAISSIYGPTSTPGGLRLPGTVFSAPATRDSVLALIGHRLSHSQRVDFFRDSIKHGFSDLPDEFYPGLFLVAAEVTISGNKVTFLRQFRSDRPRSKDLDPETLKAAMEGLRQLEASSDSCGELDSLFGLSITYRNEYFDSNGDFTGAFELQKSNCSRAGKRAVSVSRSTSFNPEVSASIDGEITSRNEMTTSFSWILHLTSTVQRTADAEIQFLDANGIVVATAHQRDLALPADVPTTFRGAAELSSAVAAQVIRLGVKVSAR